MDKPVQRRAGVFYSLTGVVLIVGVAAVLLSAGLTVWLTHLLTQQWVWDYRPPVSATDPEFGFPGAARTSLLVVAGLGGVVALVVAFRRQRHLEQDHAGQRDQIRLFTERFGAAAEQLGSAAAATRLAGVYAMAALADEWVDQRQQCVDVLCAYLRLPYRPVGESDGALRRTLTTTREGSNWRAEVADVQEFRHGERQVRLTVISVIREHLQVDRPEANWSFLDFDFSGATFDGGDFSGSYFWRKVSFGGSTFLPGNVSFTSTHFLSDRTDFTGCDFAGATVYFGGAEFVGQSVDFAGAEFSAGQVQFNGTNFASNSVNFAGAHFSGAEVTSDGATFRQGVVAFDGASFSAGSFNVTRAEFTGSEVTFRGSLFVGCGVRFDSSEFRCQRLNFDRALFSLSTTLEN